MTLDLRFDGLHAENGLADISEAKPNIAAKAALYCQDGTGGNHCEVAPALTDFLERPAVTLGRNRHTDFRQQLVCTERGLEISTEELIGGNDALTTGAPRHQ